MEIEPQDQNVWADPAEDKFHDHCGVFAITRSMDAARHAYLGLYGLQHRGQESAGIVTSDGMTLYTHKGMGYVSEVFDDAILAQLPGDSAIGHVRYSTTGQSSLHNAQPIRSDSWRGPMALAHNGNLINTVQVRQRLEEEGAIFQSSTDTEVILHLLARCPAEDLDAALRNVLTFVHGAYSLVLLTPSRVYAIRDPHGVRPLCLGSLNGSHVIASETCSFDLLGAEYIRDVVPGEILRIENGHLFSSYLPPAPRPAFCIFEHVYFSRPDSKVFERSVHKSRYKMGRQLARENPVEADLVVPVPDSGVTAALGFSDESQIPFTMGLVRNHYVGRTFIQPKQSARHLGVRVKLNPVKELLNKKRVVLIDDSIVRGTTSRKIVDMVRAAGAREVHLRISSPPTIAPCYYGMDTPTYRELIGANKSVEEIRQFVGADSLGYLSLEGMKSSVAAGGDFCSACFDEQYPITVYRENQQKVLFQLQDVLPKERWADEKKGG
jgi:amidophosphoribosyltransferase